MCSRLGSGEGPGCGGGWESALEGGRQFWGGGAERCRRKSTERDVHLLYNLTWARSLDHQSLYLMRCKMFGWGKEESCRSGNGQQKLRNRSAGEREGSPPPFSADSQQRVRAKVRKSQASQPQMEEGKENGRMTTKGALK